MFKNLVILFAIVTSLVSCTKTQQKSACGTQVCTAIFAIIGIQYTDNAGKPTAVDTFKVFNVTSNKRLYPGIANINTVQGYYVVASDGNKMEYSSEGDVIKVSATDPVTKQTKDVNFKISGGCNCHVAKISGQDTVKFD